MQTYLTSLQQSLSKNWMSNALTRVSSLKISATSNSVSGIVKESSCVDSTSLNKLSSPDFNQFSINSYPSPSELPSSSSSNTPKKVKCLICGNVMTKTYYPTHLRTHTGEKPFCCTFCPYRTGDRSNLNHHMLRHN